MTAPQGTFAATRFTLGSYDGETLGWLAGDQDMLDGLTEDLLVVDDLPGVEIDRSTIDVVTDTIGGIPYLLRDPISSVPEIDTTGDSPAVVVVFDNTGTDATRQLLAWQTPVGGTAPGFADWPYDPTNGIAQALTGDGTSGAGTDTELTVEASAPMLKSASVAATYEGGADFFGVTEARKNATSAALTGGTVTAAGATQDEINNNVSALGGFTLITANLAADVAAAAAASLADLDAYDVPYASSGLLSLVSQVGPALSGIEGFLDGERHVRGYFTAAVPDLTTLRAGAVADIDQPVTDDGQQVVKGDFVATLGDTDGDGNYWIHIVHPTTGQWGSVPSNGTIVPTGAGSWDNAISTNHLAGGNVFVSKSGAIGVFVGERTNGSFTGSRGGPDLFTDDFNGGEWVIVAGGGGGSPTGSAGGDLSGTYPNPTIGTGKVTSAMLAAALAETMPVTVYPASTLSATSTITLADATGLSFAVVSGKRYQIDGCLIVTGDAAGDMKVAFTHPGGTMDITLSGVTIATTSYVAPVYTWATFDTSGAETPIGVVSSARNGFPFRGTFVASSSGTFKLQFAQRVSSLTPTEIQTTSYMTYRVAP